MLIFDSLCKLRHCRSRGLTKHKLLFMDDKKMMRTNENNTTINTTMEGEKMDERAIVNNGKISLSKVEELLGVTNYTMNKYLSIMEELIDNGFLMSDFRKIINAIYTFAEYNNIDAYDIDIKETQSNKICIFFDSYIYIFKNGIRMKIRCRLNYYDHEIQFIESSVYNYSTDRIKYVGTIDQLKEVIDKFSQGD